MSELSVIKVMQVPAGTTHFVWTDSQAIPLFLRSELPGEYRFRHLAYKVWTPCIIDGHIHLVRPISLIGQFTPQGMQMVFEDDVIEQPVLTSIQINQVIAIDPPAPEWDGQGYPPVGIIIEAYIRSGFEQKYAWRRAKVVHGSIDGTEGEVLVYELESTTPYWTDEFRPVRTPEQVAAEQRVSEINAMIGHIKELRHNNHGVDHLTRLKIHEDVCVDLHAAGYCKPIARPPVDMDAVRDALCTALGDAYDCTRVWAAWAVGTMTQDDFALVSDDSDRLQEIAVAVLTAAGVEVQP